MKRRASSRRPVLDLHPDESRSLRRNWHSKQKYYTSMDGFSKPLKTSGRSITGYDSDNESSAPDVNLDSKLKDFLKEINECESNSQETTSVQVAKKAVVDCVWQECFDKSTGYSYYWNIETNAVTWEMPSEYKLALQTHTLPNSSSLPNAEQINTQNRSSPDKNKYIKANSPQRVVYRTNNKNEKYKNDNLFKENKSNIHESDSDDEKIEMITSYGEDSGSEEENSQTSDLTSKKNFSLEKSSTLPTLPIGPTIIYRIQPEPQVVKLHQKRQETSKELLDYNLQPPSTFQKLHQAVTRFQSELKKGVEFDAIEKSDDKKNVLDQLIPYTDLVEENITSKPEKTEVSENLQTLDKEQSILPEANSNSAPNKLSNMLITLVAGYGEDSDIDEDVHESKENVKTLFPILDSQISNVQKPTNDVAEFNIKPEILNLPLLNNLPDTCSKSESKSDVLTSESHNKTKPSYLDLQDSEELIDTKAFKRKRRIALDIFPRVTAQNISKDVDFTGGQYTDPIPEERKGFGFSQTEENSVKLKHAKNKYEGMFIKAETINVVKEITTNASDTDEFKNINKKEIEDMLELVNEKVIFLAEGKEPVSAVQAIAIQLQTLVAAHKDGALKSIYLHNWLEETSIELKKLEHEVAPTGWTCQWDRSNKRYFYRNQQSGEIQWQYPDVTTDIVGGAEAMDICTTPPPPDDEHALQQTVEKQSQSASITEKPKTPPPPVITNWPSQKKNKELPNEDESATDSVLKLEENEHTSNEIEPVNVLPPLPPTEPKEMKPPLPLPSLLASTTHNEPLPPGIDPPDLPYMIAKPKELNVPVLSTDNSDTVCTSQENMAVEKIVQSSTQDYSVSNTQNLETLKQIQSNKNLGSELESFYSDIASLESVKSNCHEQVINDMEIPDVSSLESQGSIETNSGSILIEVKKKKKEKVKIASGLTLKKKKVSSLVEKWKKVQHDFKN